MKGKIKKIASLQIESDAVRVDSLFCKIQKIGTLIMCVILFGALIGWFGPGIFGKQHISLPNVEVHYSKFPRLQSSSVLIFYIKNSKNPTFIWISNDFFEKNRVLNVTPRPALEEGFNNGIRFTFHVSSTKLENIIFFTEPEKFGFLSSQIRINENSTFQLKQFIYP